MAVLDPADHPDRTLVWNDHFDRRRRNEIESLLTDELIAEHAANPLGYRQFHSPGLQRVLNYFRAQPILGKYVVYASKPWHEYRIAVVSERGQPARILPEPVFASEEGAMHGVFLKRCEELRASHER